VCVCVCECEYMSFSTGTKRRLVTLCVCTNECKCMCMKVCVGGVGWEGVCVRGVFLGVCVSKPLPECVFSIRSS
jgi:hypothetical protein